MKRTNCILDKNSFKAIYDDYFDQLRSYIYYRCGDEAIASDIAQDSFLKLWEQRNSVKSDTILQFLYTIARNLQISNFRHKKVELEFRSKVSHDTIENEYFYNETKKNYESILSKMPENQREVFLMSRMDGLKYAEIADRLGLSVKAVEKRMTKALCFLKLSLQPESTKI